MELNAENIASTSKGFKTVFMTALALIAPQLTTAVALEIQGGGSSMKLMIPELFGGMRKWVGDRHIKALMTKGIDLVPDDYEATVGVPVNAIKDDNIGLYNASMQNMAVAAGHLPEDLLSTLLINGFTDNGYDEVPFFGDTHPMEDGNTQSNKLTAALDATAFEAAWTKLRAMKDFGGEPLRVLQYGRPKLIVGPDNEAAAEAIVAVATTAAGAGNRNYNKADIIVDPRLDGDAANYWYLAVSAPGLRPFFLWPREKPTFVSQDQPDSDGVFNRKEIVHGVNARYDAAYGFWQLIVGSDGTT